MGKIGAILGATFISLTTFALIITEQYLEYGGDAAMIAAIWICLFLAVGAWVAILVWLTFAHD